MFYKTLKFSLRTIIIFQTTTQNIIARYFDLKKI